MAGNFQPRGIIAPLLTPFDAEGRLDPAGAARLVQWLVDRRVVSGVFCRSGMGQMFTFSLEDARQLVRAVTQAAAGRLRVYAGCTGEWNRDLAARPDPQRYTEQSIELAAYAREQGADAAVFIMPEALTAPPGRELEEVIFDYFTAIARAVEIPLFIYQAPGLASGYNMTPSLLRRLLALPSVRGMKVSTQSHQVFDPLAEAARGAEHFSLIAGAEHFYLEALPLGARGCLGGGCMTHPEMIFAIGYHYHRGDLAAAQAAQEDTLATLRAVGELKVEGAVAGKLYLAAKGYACQPYRRPPGTPLPSAEQMAAYTELLDRRVAPYREAVARGELAL